MNTAFRFVLTVVMAIVAISVTLPNTSAAVSPDPALAMLQGRNIISGTVFGDTRRPVTDLYVELLDDFNSSINRAKTDGSGRFNFGGIPDGRYRVHVLTYGTDYLEQTQEVILTSMSTVTGGSGSDRQNIDFVLKLNERAIGGPFAVAPGGVLFVQDIPVSARKSYEDGIRFLREKKEAEGFVSLKKALEIFPDYYQALDRLGAEYAIRGVSGKPEDREAFLRAGFALLSRAADVNPRGVASIFGLGWTQYQLGMNAEAIETLKKATTLYAKSADPFLWLGKALERASSLPAAEVALKQANDLSKGKVGEIHWHLAGVYNGQKRYKEAAEEFELYLKTEPKAADAEKIKVLIKQLREKAGTRP
ncbi:MAG: carboxypeptidase regulatory-like domain-containing protein [Pyrinomonadaceae bacterium]